VKKGEVNRILFDENDRMLVILDDVYFSDEPVLAFRNDGYSRIILEYQVLKKDDPMMEMLISALVKSHSYELRAEKYEKAYEDASCKLNEYVKAYEDAGCKLNEYRVAYETLEQEIERIHETKTWKIGEKIGRIAKRN
jgi:hypothetical protein